MLYNTIDGIKSLTEYGDGLLHDHITNHSYEKRMCTHVIKTVEIEAPLNRISPDWVEISKQFLDLLGLSTYEFGKDRMYDLMIQRDYKYFFIYKGGNHIAIHQKDRFGNVSIDRIMIIKFQEQ